MLAIPAAGSKEVAGERKGKNNDIAEIGDAR
jgi:hypothetical protein